MRRQSAIAAALIYMQVFILSALGEPSFEMVIDANRVSIRCGDPAVAQYRYGDVAFKPYIETLRTPGGVNVLLDSPQDHVHHHGLMFSVAVDGLNFWEEMATSGHQQHNRFAEVAVQQESECFTESLRWIDPSGKEVLSEQRKIRLCQAGEPKATILTWDTHLSRAMCGGKGVLSGAHYHGLGMRFVRSMDGGEFFNADGKEGTIFRGEERLVRSNWCAYTAAVDGKPVTVAMFGHPINPRPTTWFTMAKPFAYLSATLNLHEEPLSIDVEKPLVLRYAVVVWDGKVGRDHIDQTYEWFTRECPVSPSVCRDARENDPNN